MEKDMVALAFRHGGGKHQANSISSPELHVNLIRELEERLEVVP
nr:hypothetical protein [Oryza sativa Japonica Group]